MQNCGRLGKFLVHISVFGFSVRSASTRRTSGQGEEHDDPRAYLKISIVDLTHGYWLLV